MAKMTQLTARAYSSPRSPWSTLHARKHSPGPLQLGKRKMAVLTRSGKMARDAKQKDTQVTLSARMSATANHANGNGFCALTASPIPSPCVTPEIAKRRPRDRTQRKILLTQFRFQSFKKCFRMKCATIIVPGDFKPCSPRRMFCSQECFEAHWKEKLSGNLWTVN